MSERDEGAERIAFGDVVAGSVDATDLAKRKAAGIARVVAQIIHSGVERGADALLVVSKLLAFAMFPRYAGADHRHVLRRLDLAVGNFCRALFRLGGDVGSFEQIMGRRGNTVARRTPIAGAF